VAHLGADVILE